MSTTPSFDDYLQGFRARALERMEAFEKAVEKAQSTAVQAGKNASHSPPAGRTPNTPPSATHRAHRTKKFVNDRW
ncbi:hypothetical protein [Corynebacterium aquilae]|uniref:Uncharacterized protein n=1 Tax=Corynebacterium aquilae DSM 44791 TaxID=1431546 RepID=A0A1L7CDY6_9CORY|nr:hypothetical protein [Corynebacterium aquilae]APT84080.1 hypothetical protein CAQU_02210 [Corynebacterium aquilae DSM 44791]